MVQELGENRSAEIHSPFSHLRSSPSGRPFLAYLSSNRKNLKSPLIHSLSIDWEDSRCRLPDGTEAPRMSAQVPAGGRDHFPISGRRAYLTEYVAPRDRPICRESREKL